MTVLKCTSLKLSSFTYSTSRLPTVFLIRMPPSKPLLLRFESKEGQFRLTVLPSDQFTSLLSPVSFKQPSRFTYNYESLMLSQILDKLPKNVDSTTITLSNKAHNGEERQLSSLKGVTIERVGLRYDSSSGFTDKSDGYSPVMVISCISSSVSRHP